MKFGTNITLLLTTPNFVHFKCIINSNTNMTDMRACEVEGTLAPLNIRYILCGKRHPENNVTFVKVIYLQNVNRQYEGCGK